MQIYIYIYISIHIYIFVCVCVCVCVYVVPSISLQTFFFVQVFKLVMAIHLWRWTATAAIRTHPTKARLSQLLNFKMQSDNLKERYAIKFCFKQGKYATETYGMLQTAFRPSCMNRASVFERHKKFKEGRESLRDDERCGRSKEVNRPELIGQRVRVRVTMLRF